MRSRKLSSTSFPFLSTLYYTSSHDTCFIFSDIYCKTVPRHCWPHSALTRRLDDFLVTCVSKLIGIVTSIYGNTTVLAV